MVEAVSHTVIDLWKSLLLQHCSDVIFHFVSLRVGYSRFARCRKETLDSEDGVSNGFTEQDRNADHADLRIPFLRTEIKIG